MARRWAPGITTAQRVTITPEEREFIFDTDLNRWYVGDGSTVGGLPLAFKSEVDTLPTNSNASSAVVTSTGSTTARTLADRFADVVNVKDFGAVGDGVTNDGPAFAAANAAGATKYVPYSANGYYLGTTSGLTVDNGESWIGDGNVKLISATTTRLFDITSNLAIGSLIQGFTIDMTGAGASSMAIRFENTNPVSNGVVRDVQFQNCYRAIGCTGSASYIFECLIENVRCILTKGLQIYLPFSRGFVQLKKVNIDNTLPANERVTWASILIEKPAGVFLEDVDVTGQANEAGPWALGNAYTPAYDAGAIGIKIDGAAVNEGYVWLRRVRCESSMGPGIQVIDLVFLYGETVETYACLGNAIYLEDVIEGGLTNITGRGAVGLTGASASSHGITLVDCQGLQITNAKGINNTGHGILFSGASCLYNMVNNAQCWDNTLYGVADASSAASNVVIGADFRNNGSGDKAVSGSDSVVVLNRGGAALAFLNNPTSANLRALLSDESGSGAALFANGAIGTPASGTLTNCTGLPITTGVSGLGSNVATFLATPSSANLAAALTDESGGSIAMFGTAATSWTPGVAFGGSATGVTYSTQTGSYTRIGDIVIAMFYIELTNNGSGSGAATITGLPITSANATHNFGALSGFQVTANGALITGQLTARVGPNVTTASLFQQGATSVAALTESNLTDTAVLTGTLIYKV